MELWKQFITSFVDKRNIQYDKTMNLNSAVLGEWLKIYEQYKKITPIKYIPVNKPFRMISAVIPPKNTKQLDILTTNLKYYKSIGYDSVLVVFMSDNTVEDVVNTIKYIKQYCEMNVWLAYGAGDMQLSVSVWMDPQQYTEILTNAAPYLTGYINSWFRTSSHLWEQDLAFMNYTNTILRNANANLPIVGELYFGNNHKNDTITDFGWITNLFPNASGVMIMNFGIMRN